jgi:hypothetical protein
LEQDSAIHVPQRKYIARTAINRHQRRPSMDKTRQKQERGDNGEFLPTLKDGVSFATRL